MLKFPSIATASPRQVVVFAIVANGLLWTLLPYFANYTLPLDVVQDGMSWGHDFQWGYYKHPPLVFWLIRISVDLAGDLGPYLLSQVFVGATVFFVFELGRRIFDDRRAAVGALLLYGVYYFSWPTPEFNHNVAEMPLWAAGALLLHRCLREGRARDWLLLGLVAGLGVLTKYVFVVFAAAAALYVLSSARRRRALASPWPAAAIVLAALVVSPHLFWLTQHDFMTLHYLGDRLAPVSGPGGRLASVADFLGAQLVDHAPMLILASIAGLIGVRSFRPGGVANRDDTAFLIALGLGPAALSCLVPILKGVALRPMWGAPMWDLSGLLVVNHFAPRLEGGISPRRVAVGSLSLMAVVAAAYGLWAHFGQTLSGKPLRTGWPDRAMAAQLESNWRKTTSCPLRIVVGDNWLAGLVALRSGDRPSVLIDGNMKISPWITDDRLAKEGALVAWRLTDNKSQRSGMPAPFDLAPRGIVVSAWPLAKQASPLRIAWTVLPPAPHCGG